ncbi:MAG: L,D-transpeptidase family protein [Desulfuromonadaceae bacterium]|nr:L,D-transpeptidase family protein [Desulfuromonadaceae bacterium]
MIRSYIVRAATYLCFVWVAVLSHQRAFAAEVQFRHGVGGSTAIHTVRVDDSLVELARRYDIGYNEIEAANAGVDPFVPDAGIAVTIPGKWILPDIQVQKGIVINLAEMRLYYFDVPSRGVVETFPVGIGDEGWDTPTGIFHVIEKIVNPAWHVPASIRKQKPELPLIVPSGPDNPLGTHALRLSVGTVLIHGTDRPFGIGRRVSHGCIHLYPEDIVRLFRKVRIGTRVVIVRQPVKVATVDNRVLVEIHADGNEELEEETVNFLERKGLLDRVDNRKLQKALLARSGVPTDITRN